MHNPLSHASPKNKVLIVLSTIFILGSLGFDIYQYWMLRERNGHLENEIAQLQDTISLFQKNLLKTRIENATITDALHTEKANNDFFQTQIQDITGTVKVLEKLSKTDSELLKKYSKIYFLNENYVPESLAQIDPKYLYTKEKPLQIQTNVLPHLEALLNAAQNDNVTIQIISAYRSFGTQAILKSSYKITYGIGTANKFSAEQGYSEHQLGTTVDFTTPSIGATFIGFEKTDAYKWLLQNAYRYGFIISYPKENTYYAFEPWHFRFVGISLATRLHDQNNYFYALDQRDIDQYLINLFD